LPLAAGVCFVFGFLMGFPALRLGSIYLALATFALALATPQLLKYKNIESWTGGAQGIILNKPESPINFSVAGVPINEDRWMYLLALAVAGLLFWLAANLLRGRIGRALIAIRDHPIAAAAMGINLPIVKSTTFGISAAYTGVAGALSAMAIGFVSPDSYPGLLSITMLVGVVVGGLASIPGAFLGAIFILVVPDLADQISKSAPSAIYGLLLIGVMLVMPTGIVGAIQNLWRSRLRRKSE
jgi:branched-chain amino acid transport system permease protein